MSFPNISQNRNDVKNDVKSDVIFDVKNDVKSDVITVGACGAERARSEPAQLPLGNTTKLVSLDSKVLTVLSKLSSSRGRRFMIQAGQRELLRGERVGICLRMVVPGRYPEVWHSPSKQKAHYKGLVVCGSVWNCAVCASKISERRRAELSKGLEGCELQKVLVTYTFQHNRDDRLYEMRGDFKMSMKSFYGGKGWEKLRKRYGWVGQITGTETTWGESAGWHLHEHVLYFLKPGCVDLAQLRDDISSRFEMVMMSHGRYVSPTYGVDLAVGDDLALNLYGNKWGLEDEITKSNVKKSRSGFSPFELVEKYLQGEKWAGDLYKEFAAAIKGCKQLRWSEGLRARLGLNIEKTDDELAIEAVDQFDVLLASLSFEDWKLVLGQDARADLLNVADSGDPDAITEFLRILRTS